MTDVPVPVIGESIKTVFIGRWLVEVGTAVAEGDPILEIDSDKASLEVPAPVGGVLTEQKAEEGDEVEIGAVIAVIDESAEASAPAPKAAASEPEPAAKSGDTKAGPAARRAAKESGVAIDSVTGTGPRGRVTSADVNSASSGASKTESAPASDEPAPAPLAGGARPVDRVRMSPMRRTIARRLLEAKQTTAMLTTFNECDLTNIIELRKQYQDRFVKKNGFKLGFMSFFVKAAIEALKEYPAVNAEIDGNEIVYKGYYNIAVAVSGPKGLVVPVIPDADRLSFAQTEKAIADVAVRARDNKLRPSDFEDGTFTISNGGIFGSMMSTPILNPPQVGILGMHAIQRRPIAVGDKVEIRPMMYLALSYDHRIIDGREAVQFLVRIKECVEEPSRLLLEV